MPEVVIAADELYPHYYLSSNRNSVMVAVVTDVSQETYDRWVAIEKAWGQMQDEMRELDGG